MASVNLGNQLETPLAREGSSVFALTFHGFQHALGDTRADLGSMNMDEFLTNLWTAEESQAMAAAIDGADGGLATQISLPRQGSLFLPKTLSTKTVDEVWKSLQVQQETLVAGGGQQEVALAEVTLEDFLVKAGIVRESPSSNPPPLSFHGIGEFPGQGNARYDTSCNGSAIPVLIPPSGGALSSIDIIQQDSPQDMLSPVHIPAQQGDWMVNRYTKAFSHQQQHAPEQILQGSYMSEAASTSLVANGPFPEASLVAGVMGKAALDMSFGGEMCLNELGCGAASPLSAGPNGSSADMINPFTAQFGILTQPTRKRCAEGPIEQVIHRRQRRMIKNRESAARSRARKQAYTAELEEEVSQLKEEKMELLRKQEEVAELRKQQILAVMPSSVLKEGCALKRTHTGPW